MAITKLNLNQESNLEFEVKVEGADDSNADVRFVIESNDYSISFKGERTQDGYAFKIPSLKGIVQPGLHECALNVNIGEFLFKPIVDRIEIEQPVVVEAVTKPIAEISKIKVEAKTPVMTEEAITKVSVTDFDKYKSLAEEYGYNLIQTSTAYIAMSDKKVVGAYNIETKSGYINK